VAVVILQLAMALSPAISHNYEFARHVDGSGAGADASARPVVVVMRNYLTTQEPDASLLALLFDVFNLHVLEDAELLQGSTLYDDLVALDPGAVLRLVFAGPAHADAESECSLQRATDHLGIPLLSVCLEVPAATLAGQGTASCGSVWLRPDAILVNERFSTRFIVWERRTSGGDAHFWHYDAGTSLDASASSSQMTVYQAVAALIHVALANATTSQSPELSSFGQGNIALYLAARSAGLCSRHLTFS